jgi:hypothetical protein
VIKTHRPGRLKDDAPEAADPENLLNQCAAIVAHIVVAWAQRVGVGLAVGVSNQQVATGVIEAVVVSEDDPPIHG